jgi:F-type H+-transporting ATPase subunit delta
MRGASRASLVAVRESVDRSTRGTDPDELRRTAGELFSVVQFLGAQARLRRMVSDPAVDGDRRAGLLTELLGDQVSDPCRAMLESLVKSRWAHPGDLVDATDEVAAQVLFTAEEQDGSLDEVEDELFRFARILDREPKLRAALTDPSLPAATKQELLEDLLGAKVRPATAVLVEQVVLHSRGRTIDRGLEEYARQAAARRDNMVARVSTVVPLSDEQQQRLAEGLARQLGHSVHLNIEVDPDLVGGLTVRVGDQLYDGSVAHRLAAVRRLMTG